MIIFIHFPIQLSADLPEDSLLLTSHHNMGHLPVAMTPNKTDSATIAISCQ